MYREKLGVYLAVCSYKRPQNVALMTELIGEATWYLSSEEDAAAYREAGVTNIRVVKEPDGSPGGLQRKRNQVLKDAWAANQIACIMSDDLRKVTWLEKDPNGKKGKHGGFSEVPISFEDGFIRFMKTWYNGDEWGKYWQFHLGGTMPAPNPFYRNAESGVRTTLFIIGDFMVVKPEAELFLDLAFKVKDDYDYTMAHLVEYGGVYRNDDFMLYFLHNSNAGGLVDERTAALSRADIAELKDKWGASITEHPTRENEILLKFKPQQFREYMEKRGVWQYLPKVEKPDELEAAQKRTARQEAYVAQRIRSLDEQNALPDKKDWLVRKILEGMAQLEKSATRLEEFRNDFERLTSAGMEG